MRHWYSPQLVDDFRAVCATEARPVSTVGVTLSTFKRFLDHGKQTSRRRVGLQKPPLPGEVTSIDELAAVALPNGVFVYGVNGRRRFEAGAGRVRRVVGLTCQVCASAI